jgi:enoyl-CoA hydratase
MPEQLITSTVDGHVGIITLNRPKVLHALNPQLMTQLADQLEAWDADPAVHVVLIKGSDRAFAAGADIGDMADRGAIEMWEHNQFTTWDRIKRVRKPLVAAVSGFALGGGCELMMMCDVIVASETAQIGQPEINLGVMPGAGGTQRLTRALGKALAMDLILTGRMLTAREAHAHGLVSRVVPADHWEREALKVAHEIASKSPVALRFAKDCVLKADEASLSEGVEYERRLFYMLFASDDQKEGMKAFVEKRKPKFIGR